MQAGGQRFEPVRLHQPSLKLRLASQLQIAKVVRRSSLERRRTKVHLIFPEMKTTVSAVKAADLADLPPFFDIVNGF